MKVIACYLFVLFFCLGTLFGSSYLFVDAQIIPKWLAAIFCVCLFGMVCVIKHLKKPFSLSFAEYKVKGCIWIIVVLSSLQALYGLLQYARYLPPTTSFRISGSFDNPAGFAACLCAAFPLFIFLFENGNKVVKFFVVLSGGIIGISVILSESRAGIVSLIAICGIFLLERTRLRYRVKLLLLLSILSVFVPVLYFLKRDSADGRLLIWQCSWNMIADKPLTGYGSGGFESHYMDYQAAFFRHYPTSDYALLADSVQHPFNEYLRLLVDYGLVGLFGLFAFLSFLVFCYCKKRNGYSKAALLCLASIATFSMFSYPSVYPFVWFIFTFSSCILIFNAGIIRWRVSMSFLKCLSVLFVVIYLYVGVRLAKRMETELEWKRISSLSLCGQTEKMLPRYRKLEKELSEDRYFLYNYSAELYEAKRYSESLSVLRDCRQLWADYDVEMLIAKNCQELKRYSEAESHYRLASQMCPNRFMPLYQIVLLLEEMQQVEEAKIIAKVIVNKRVKVPSLTVNRIKDEMRKRQ